MTLRRRLARVIAGDASGETIALPDSRRASVTAGRMKRAKPPNVVGRGPLLASPGFGVVIVAIVRDEADYLEEWLAYHVALGVDHVLLYDNGSTDGTAGLLARYQNHGLVTRIDWPLRGGQLAAYNHSLRFFGATARWLAYYDVDEFLVPLVDDDIPSFLDRFPDAADVRVPRKEFGFSGHRSPPEGLTIEAYTQVADVLGRDPTLPARVKSVVQPAAISAVDVHLAFPADEPTPDAPTETAEESVAGVAQLNHYYTRSFEEFEAKRFRGSATGRISRPAVPFDIPTLEADTAAQRFAERTRATIERLRRLEPQPYSYGSQLRLSWFPRPDDLGRFAEFALANTAAGLQEPRRAAASRIRNLHAGIGLVGDLSTTSYQPAWGGLSGSIHTAVLVEHMRGRVAASLAGDATAGADRFVAITGRLDRPADGPASLVADADVARMAIDLPKTDTLRCYSVGLLLGSAAPVGLTLRLERSDGSMSEPVTIDLPASTCLAGIVEIERLPQEGARVHLEARTSSPALAIYDLFVVSCG